MDAQTFFHELKRRNVYKVAIAYAVIAWLLIEAASLLLFGHQERISAVTALVVIMAIGFSWRSIFRGRSKRPPKE